MPAYFIYKEIGSKFTVLFILKSSRRKQCHMHSSQRELQRFNAIISWKTHKGSRRFNYFFKSKLSPVSSLPWPMNKINSLKTHFYYVYTICRIDEHVDMKNTPAWYEHLSCSYCYQEDPSKSAVAHRSYLHCMNRSAHPIGFSCWPIRAIWQGVDKVLYLK